MAVPKGSQPPRTAMVSDGMMWDVSLRGAPGDVAGIHRCAAVVGSVCLFCPPLLAVHSGQCPFCLAGDNH